MIELTIDQKLYQAEEGSRILDVALSNGIYIPHLCYNENLQPHGGCRLCLVEVTKGGKTTLTTSCTYPATEGIGVKTNTAKIKRARRLVMELLLPLAPDAPKIQALAREQGITRPRFKGEEDGCIRCGLCIRACSELVGANALTFAQRGYRRTVGPPFEEEPENCIGCGACVFICPTGCIGIEEKREERKIKRWNKTLQMKTCESCGRSFIPYAQIEFALRRAADPPFPEWFEKCPNCR